jgi:hypothetical protein
MFLNNWLAVLDAHRELLGRMLKVSSDGADPTAATARVPTGNKTKRTPT